jgi:hypothetical protein
MKKPRAFDPTAPQGCSYIAGDPGVIRRGEDPFCGKEREKGSVYCAEHKGKCWQPPKKTREPVVSIETGRVFR